MTRLAQQHLKGTLELLTPIEVVQWIAKDPPATEEDLRRIDQPSLRQQVQFATGLRYYARGQNDLALKMLSSETYQSYFWSRYVIENIEAERRMAK